MFKFPTEGREINFLCQTIIELTLVNITNDFSRIYPPTSIRAFKALLCEYYCCCIIVVLWKIVALCLYLLSGVPGRHHGVSGRVDGSWRGLSDDWSDLQHPQSNVTCWQQTPHLVPTEPAGESGLWGCVLSFSSIVNALRPVSFKCWWVKMIQKYCIP